jgi:hypothetical protein
VEETLVMPAKGSNTEDDRSWAIHQQAEKRLIYLEELLEKNRRHQIIACVCIFFGLFGISGIGTTATYCWASLVIAGFFGFLLLLFSSINVRSIKRQLPEQWKIVLQTRVDHMNASRKIK